jgi:hypothetical protein
LKCKYFNIPDLATSANLLHAAVWLRFAEQNHKEAITVEVLTMEFTRKPLIVADFSSEPALPLDALFERVLNEDAMASTVLADVDEMNDEEGETNDEEEAGDESQYEMDHLDLSDDPEVETDCAQRCQEQI